MEVERCHIHLVLVPCFCRDQQWRPSIQCLPGKYPSRCHNRGHLDKRKAADYFRQCWKRLQHQSYCPRQWQPGLRAATTLRGLHCSLDGEGLAFFDLFRLCLLYCAPRQLQLGIWLSLGKTTFYNIIALEALSETLLLFQQYLGQGVVQYAIHINFTLTIMPQRDSYYHRTFITAQVGNACKYAYSDILMNICPDDVSFVLERLIFEIISLLKSLHRLQLSAQTEGSRSVWSHHIEVRVSGKWASTMSPSRPCWLPKEGTFFTTTPTEPL